MTTGTHTTLVSHITIQIGLAEYTCTDKHFVSCDYEWYAENKGGEFEPPESEYFSINNIKAFHPIVFKEEGHVLVTVDPSTNLLYILGLEEFNKIEDQVFKELQEIAEAQGEP